MLVEFGGAIQTQSLVKFESSRFKSVDEGVGKINLYPLPIPYHRSLPRPKTLSRVGITSAHFPLDSNGAIVWHGLSGERSAQR